MHVMRSLCFCSGALAAGIIFMVPSIMVEGGSCKTLSNKDSIFVDSLVTMSEIPSEIWTDFPLENVMAPFDQAFPWISSCLANIDPVALLLNATTNQAIERCTGEINNATQPQEDESDDVNPMDILVRDYVCPLYRNTLVPCANDIVLKTITNALDSSNGCCDALKQKVVDSFGQDITPMANALMKLAGDIVCSTKTYTVNNVDEVTETCGASIVYSFMDENMTGELLDLLQTPEDQTCAALTGKEYATTKGRSARLFDRKTPLDVCYTPIASLLQHIASYPLIKDMITYDGNVKMTDMFEGSSCIDGGKLVEWALSQESMVQQVLRMMDNALWASMEISGTNAGNFGPFQPTEPVSGEWGGSAPSSWSGSFSDGWGSDATEDDSDSDSGHNTSVIMSDYIRSNELAFKDLCFHIPTVVSECSFKAKLSIFSVNNGDVTPSKGGSGDDSSSTDSASGSSNNANVRTSSATTAFMITSGSMLVIMMTTFLLYLH